MPIAELGCAHKALGTLVQQFRGEYEFVRELVQNALDSGSAVVRVSTTYEPADDSSSPTAGLAAIHVDDDGSGMSRVVIEEHFTRLFASTKEDDLTCIGKFGVGFVSVFSVEPESVVVTTGTGVECWELVIDSDRRFDLYALENVRQGTCAHRPCAPDSPQPLPLCALGPALVAPWDSCRRIAGDPRSNSRCSRSGESLPMTAAELVLPTVEYKGELVSLRTLEHAVAHERSLQNQRVHDLEALRRQNEVLAASLGEALTTLDSLAGSMRGDQPRRGWLEWLRSLFGSKSRTHVTHSIEELLKRQYEHAARSVREVADLADRMAAAEQGLFDEIDRLNRKIVASADNESKAAAHVLALEKIQRALEAERLRGPAKSTPQWRILESQLDRVQRALWEHSTKLGWRQVNA